MSRQLAHYMAFLREVRRTFYTTGALLPSGQQLARATVVPFRQRTRPARVLEVGPGSGAVTQELVKHLRPGDVLDIVEVNDRFVDILRKRFETEPDFQKCAGQSTIHHLAVQDFQATAPYDFIMSGVPVNNFPHCLVKGIFRRYDELIAPGGILSFFEYLWVRNVKSLVASRQERLRLARVGCVLGWYLDRYCFEHNRVFVNLPPAVVHHLRLGIAAESAKSNDFVAA